MKSNRFFSKIRTSVKFLVLGIGAINIFIWAFWFFAFLLALGTDGPKGDFGHDWLHWVMTHQAIAIIWSFIGIYSLIKGVDMLEPKNSPAQG